MTSLKFASRTWARDWFYWVIGPPEMKDPPNWEHGRLKVQPLRAFKAPWPPADYKPVGVPANARRVP